MDDVPDVTEACQDQEISRWTSAIPWPYRPDHARDWIATHPDERAGGVVRGGRRHDGPPPRLDRIARRAPRAGDAEIGYWVAAWARSRGVATRAVGLMTRWAFSDFALVYLDLLTKLGNETSERVAIRAGYRYAGEVSGIPSALDPDRHFDAKRWTTTADGRPPLEWPPDYAGRG